MAHVSLRRALACVVVAGATAGIIYGVSQITFLSGGRTDAAVSTSSVQDVTKDTDAVTDMTEVWTPPASAPEASDTDARIAAGDFSVLHGADPEELKALTQAFDTVRVRSRYVRADVTNDGREELLWLAERADTKAEQVIAVFVREEDGLRLLVSEPDETADEYYLSDGRDLYFVLKNDWIISEYHCTKVLFDRNEEMYGGDTLSMYMVEDAALFESDVDAAMKRRLTFVDGRGVWYQTQDAGQDAESARRVHADEWLRLFSARTRQNFADVAPAFEARRSGIETGVAAYVDTVRRSSYAEVPFSEVVRYPQVTEGERMETVNRLLKEAAFSLAVGEERAADGAACLEELKRTMTKARDGEVYYRVSHNASDMISVQFGISRSVDGIPEDDRIRLITIEKSSGRQIQIGDLTSIEKIEQAARAGYAELFTLRADGTGLIIDTDPAHDGVYMAEAIARTRTSSDNWKNIGLDEQYIYLGVIVRDGAAADTILRVPRWRVGMSSPGHMELLTMHNAYPYLKETLDGAQSLTVRRKGDGFEISFLTPDGGRVSAHLHEEEIRIPEAYTVPAVRDLMIYEYPDVTGIVIGELTLSGAEEKTADYYIVDSSLGAIGRVLLDTPDGSFEITQSRFNTNDGFFGALTGTEGAQVRTIFGEYHEDASGYAVWHNYDNGSVRMTRSVSDTARFVFELTPLDDPEEEETLRLEIYPEDAEYASEVFALSPGETTVTFRDINADGYDDLTIGAIDASDHTDEYNFFYMPAMNRYVQGPEELQDRVDYAYEKGSGYVLITEDATKTLYAPDEDGRLLRLRSITESAEGAAHTVRVLAYDGEDTQEETEEDEERTTDGGEVLLDTFSDARCSRFTDALFSSEIVWRAPLVRFLEDGNAGDDGTYVYVLRHRVPDIISPYDLAYVCVVHPEDGVLGMSVLPEEEDEEIGDAYLTEVATALEDDVPVLILTFVREDEETQEADEIRVAVDPYEVMGGGDAWD